MQHSSALAVLAIVVNSLVRQFTGVNDTLDHIPDEIAAENAGFRAAEFPFYADRQDSPAWERDARLVQAPGSGSTGLMAAGIPLEDHFDRLGFLWMRKQPPFIALVCRSEVGAIILSIRMGAV